MPKIKICGLTRKQDIDAVNAYLPDYAGFVFAESKRKLTCERASALIKGLDPKIKPVGVFVDMDEIRLAEIATACSLQAVQLHGNEDNRYLDNLRKLLPQGTVIIKAVRVKNKSSLIYASSLECDLFLLDSFREGVQGGSGEVFDWSLLEDFTKPYFLAGGLNQENIIRATKDLSPWGLDVSSGVETDGVKDRAKIAEFIRIARSL